MDLDLSTGKAEVVFKKMGYVPLSVYKCLLKIAVASLRDSDMRDYSWLRRFLLTQDYDSSWSPLAWVKGYILPLSYRSPVVYLFRKKMLRDELPRHMCMVYFSNMAFEFMLPGNRLDAFMRGGIEIRPIYMPPFFYQPVPELDFHESMIDFSNPEMVRGEEGVLHIQMDPEDLKRLGAIDPATGKKVDREFDSNKIVKLIIGHNGDELNFKGDV